MSNLFFVISLSNFKGIIPCQLFQRKNTEATETFAISIQLDDGLICKLNPQLNLLGMSRSLYWLSYRSPNHPVYKWSIKTLLWDKPHIKICNMTLISKLHIWNKPTLVLSRWKNFRNFFRIISNLMGILLSTLKKHTFHSS